MLVPRTRSGVGAALRARVVPGDRVHSVRMFRHRDGILGRVVLWGFGVARHVEDYFWYAVRESLRAVVVQPDRYLWALRSSALSSEPRPLQTGPS